eukprot:7478803-Pyramimonas_sp.AAC.1
MHGAAFSTSRIERRIRQLACAIEAPRLRTALECYKRGPFRSHREGSNTAKPDRAPPHSEPPLSLTLQRVR